MNKFQFLSKLIFRSPLNSSFRAINEDVFNEALYLSSPVLQNEYQKHLTKPLVDAKELKKLSISIYKYQTRASHRCTPFGLFAGLSIGDWNSKNEIMINADLKKTLNRKTRLDMNVLCSLAQELAKQDFIKPYLMFYPNSSIYLVGNSYRYIEYYYTNNIRYHKINKVDFSDYLQNILNESKLGLTFKQLTTLLICDDISEEEAHDFISELINAQILINQLEPTVTGNDYFETLISSLINVNNTNKSNQLDQLIRIFETANMDMKKLDENIINEIDSYKLIYENLKVILPELTEINLFQTDLYKIAVPPASSSKASDKQIFSIDSSIQTQLKNVIQFLNKISPPSPNKNLLDFKKRFYERFEDDEIPLLIALDVETGIGYPNKDLNGVNELIEDISDSSIIISENDLKWNLLQAHLLKLITESIKHNKKKIEISEIDFKEIDYTTYELPKSFTIVFNILNSISKKIELNSIGGSSAINLLGRFAGGNVEVNSIVQQLSEFEQQQYPNIILAEIVHLPESRVGNILARPSFRPYEIPYLAKSAIDDAFQIKMDDLILKIKDDKIILYDKRLKKEIIPRLGNAHNFSFNSLPVYHFLCDLETQHVIKPYIGFDWGILANQFDFLPRVEFQNTVLSSAKWQLRKQGLEPLQDKMKTDIEKYNLFFELKNKIELPDKFLIADGDNELLIDCNNPIAIDTFIDTVKNRNEITLEEYLFEDEYALIKDSDGNSFTNECIAIVLNEHTEKKTTNDITLKTFSSKQVFSIGSEWLYYKIYCGSKTMDYILTDKIKHITETLLNKNIIDKWFFIRYADPDVHLRFRIHIFNFEKYGEVLQLINSELEPLLNQHLISKIQTDTYKRELERYGDNSMELVETLFYNDSVFVTDMLDMLDADSGGTIRWLMALRSVDEFLNDFKLCNEEKYNLINALSASFFNEHGGKKELKLTLDNKFRALRPQIESVLNTASDEAKDYYPILELINSRSKANEKIIETILYLNENNELQLTINEILSSILHMNLIRLFMGRNRTNEFVVYDLLSRYYKSNLARLKSASKKETELSN
jgi:thiopeptide-type bacteriocin biosynthesis protein